jgi:predicted dehydrogenase
MTAASPRVGVIGAGGIGRTHLRAYADAGTAAVAVTDIDAARSAAAAEEFGVVAYPDLAAMILGADLDAVTVCTPPAHHLPTALQAIGGGLAVLCEKPMAMSKTECDQMIEAAQAAGVLLTVGFCHRFQPHIEAMRAAVRRGEIGTVLSFRNRFSGHLAGVEDSWFSRPEISGGGVLMDTCVHSVDLFRHLVGDVADARGVTATTATPLGPALEVEDTAVLALRSTAGVLGVIEASWRARPGEALISLHGTDGALQLDYSTLTLSRHPADGSEPQHLAVADDNRFTLQARHFLACLRGEEQLRVTAEDGAAALAVLDAVTGRTDERRPGSEVTAPVLR